MSATDGQWVTDDQCVADDQRVAEEESISDGQSVAREQTAAVDEQVTPVDEQSTPADDQPVSEEHMSTRDVRRRAVIGAVVDALRATAVRLIAVLGTLVTARLLTPYDFGLVAFGTTVLAFGDFLDDGGVGVALIRRPEHPTRSELKALVAFQFGIDLILVVSVGLVMLPFGMIGQVTTVIVASLPLAPSARLPTSFTNAA